MYPGTTSFFRGKYNTHSIVTKPLHLGISTGNRKIISILIENGANLNVKNGDGIYPLEVALGIENIKVIDLLIEKGADVKKICLCNSDNFEIIEYLISKGADASTIDINFALDDYNTLKKILHYRPDLNNSKIDAEKGVSGKQILTLLLENGLSPDARGNFPDKCPLVFAAIKYSDVETVEILRKYKAHFNVSCQSGFAETPIIMAVSEQKHDIVKKLFDYGLNINKQDWANRTPIYFAIAKNDGEMIGILADNGASLTYNKYFDENPLFFAVSSDKSIVADVLISKGADVNKIGVDKKLPVYLAIEENNLAMLRLLVDKGTNINYKREGKSIYEFALENNVAPEILSYLKGIEGAE